MRLAVDMGKFVGGPGVWRGHTALVCMQHRDLIIVDIADEHRGTPLTLTRSTPLEPMAESTNAFTIAQSPSAIVTTQSTSLPSGSLVDQT